MPKKSVIERNNKRRRMSMDLKSAYNIKRNKLITERKSLRISLKDPMFDGDRSVYIKKALLLQKYISLLPRDSSQVRYRRRCNIDGRPRGVYRDFGISRIRIRELAGNRLLPGVLKK